MTAHPIRLRLSRQSGFDLQRRSQAANGLPATNVARPSRWGNPFVICNEEGFPLITDARNGASMNDEAAALLGLSRDLRWDEAHAAAAALFRERCFDGLPDLAPLRGRNLACWCAPDAPCHADVLIEFANAEVPA